MNFDPTEKYDDVNEAAVSDWKDETTTRERIKVVITRTTEPTPASEIAEKARASQPVVRDELKELTDIGLVETIDSGQGALYKRNDQMYIYQQVLELHDAYSEAELVETLQDLKQTVNEIRTKHDVESPAELAQQLDPDDHDGWEDHKTWQTAQKNLYLAKAAISFYDAEKVVV
ncbi:winged helix-turn-helix domain-containing protein [Haloarcula pelagica]|uniref:winged helix-turn-helix domain-containing protein n=1 Tax=Haloarcula pelagica TaxID=3033389 RepID=UPI0024C2143F|nr:winged helix-turn-helix domain-containing protein [Halomicroarcula sp. YJ-61-S]